MSMLVEQEIQYWELLLYWRIKFKEPPLEGGWMRYTILITTQCIGDFQLNNYFACRACSLVPQYELRYIYNMLITVLML